MFIMAEQRKIDLILIFYFLLIKYGRYTEEIIVSKLNNHLKLLFNAIEKSMERNVDSRVILFTQIILLNR